MKKKYCEELKKEIIPADCKDCKMKKSKKMFFETCEFKKNIIVCDKCGEEVES